MLALKARHASAVAPHLRYRLSAIAAPHRVRYYAVVATSAVPQKSKVWDSVDQAVKDVKSGDVLLSGGALPFFFIFIIITIIMIIILPRASRYTPFFYLPI